MTAGSYTESEVGIVAHEWYRQKKRATYYNKKHDKTKRKLEILLNKYHGQGKEDVIRDLLWLTR